MLHIKATLTEIAARKRKILKLKHHSVLDLMPLFTGVATEVAILQDSIGIEESAI